MEKTTMTGRISALWFLLAVAGCSTQPGAPVVGAWQGSQPAAGGFANSNVDLVLRGAPDAQSGIYCIATTVVDPSARSFLGNHRWSGPWESSQRVIDGQRLTVIELKNALSDDISHYALMPDGTLHVLNPDGSLSDETVAALYTLAPVPAGPRRGRV
jgi:hypothetical protein